MRSLDRNFHPAHGVIMTEYRLGKIGDFPDGKGRAFRAGGRTVAVFRTDGKLYALANRCVHKGASLCEGPLIGLAQSSTPGEIEYTKLGEIIRCPWHGWEFDIRTGQSYCDPRRFRARAYPATVEPGTSVVKVEI